MNGCCWLSHPIASLTAFYDRALISRRGLSYLIIPNLDISVLLLAPPLRTPTSPTHSARIGRGRLVRVGVLSSKQKLGFQGRKVSDGTSYLCSAHHHNLIPLENLEVLAHPALIGVLHNLFPSTAFGE